MEGHHTGREAASGRGPDAAPPWRWNLNGLIGSAQRLSRESIKRYRGQDGSGFLQAVQQSFEQVLHGLQRIIVKQGSHLLPQQAFATPLRPGRLEQRATQLLNLADQKRQHHQYGKHHREMLIAMTKVVFEVIALVFQGIERFVFNAPPRSGSLHEPVHRALRAQVSVRGGLA